MKSIKLILFLIIILTLFQCELFSQNSIKLIFQPIPYLSGNKVYSFAYERKVSKILSVQLGGNFGVYDQWDSDSCTYVFAIPWNCRKVSETKLKGFSIFPEVRIYLLNKDKTEKLPKGFFLGVYGKLMVLNQQKEYINIDSTVNKHGQIYGLGTNVGYKFKIKSLSIEFLFGTAGGISTFPEKTGYFVIPDQFYLWRFEFALGYEF
ncbi:MAG: DUF3575 domain-containing protein [Bacteroidales bacterium]|nr:DUF3575 domain-containing protein [Bacteroidales bacterium]